jgi:hypothetical protein
MNLQRFSTNCFLQKEKTNLFPQAWHTAPVARFPLTHFAWPGPNRPSSQLRPKPKWPRSTSPSLLTPTVEWRWRHADRLELNDGEVPDGVDCTDRLSSSSHVWWHTSPQPQWLATSTTAPPAAWLSPSSSVLRKTTPPALLEAPTCSSHHRVSARGVNWVKSSMEVTP